MAVKTFVLRINEGIPENRGYILIFHRTAVLIVEFAYQLAIIAEHLGSHTCRWMKYFVKTWGFAEQTEEIDVDHAKIDQCEHDK